MYEIKFKITNLTCDACVKLSVMALNKINSVNKVEVDLVTGSVR
jgi:copper chaperone CopZ